MISGSFHTLAQEWRYYSREKALIHTLHLAQLPSSRRGDTVVIASTPPAANNNQHFHVPPLILPQTGGGGNIQITLTKNVMSTCFGSFGIAKNILAQKNMDIDFNPWANTQMTATMIPHEGGWFMIHVEAQSDQRNLTYLGPVANEQIGITVRKGDQFGHAYIQYSSGIEQVGLVDATHWNSNFYTNRINALWGTAFMDCGKGVPILFNGFDLGDPATATLSGWAFKFAEL